MLTRDVFKRLCEDLNLSEAQILQSERLHDAYLQQLAAVSAQVEDATTKKIELLELKVAPELAPDFDLSTVSDERRMKVEGWKRNLEQSGDTMMFEAEYVAGLNEISAENARALNAVEKEHRQKMLAEVEGILGDGQMARWPRAIIRCELNLHSLSPLATVSNPGLHGDPDWHLDWLGMLSEASSDGNELDVFEDAIGDIDPIAVDDPSYELGSLLEESEQCIATQLMLHEGGYETWRNRWITSRKDADATVQTALVRQQSNQRRIVFEFRDVYVRRIADLANAVDDRARGDAFIRRFHRWTCPSLFSEDSVDVIARWVMDDPKRDPGLREAVQMIYEEYVRAREPLRQKSMKLEIDEFCTQLEVMVISKRRSVRDQLAELGNQRVTLARSHLERIRGVVGEELLGELNAMLRNHYTRHFDSSEVRP